MGERSVVITGASTGIGRASALRLDREGWSVFAGVRKESDGEALKAEASERLRPVSLDVTDQASIAAAAKVVGEAVSPGGLQGLVNNAGITVNGPLEYLPLDDLRRQLEVNVVGPIAVTQAFLPFLRVATGRIVLMGSVAGRAPSVPLIGPYSASKKALEALGDSLRGELRPAGIHVALIEPGSIDTPIWDKGVNDIEPLIESLPPEGRDYYEAAMRKGTRIARKSGERGIDPDRVAKRVQHALESPRPRTRYLVGIDAIARTYVEGSLPDKLRDRIAKRLLFD